MFNVFAVCVNAVGSNDSSLLRVHVIANASIFVAGILDLARAATSIFELPFAWSRDSAFVQNRMETKVPSPASFSDGTSGHDSDVLRSAPFTVILFIH